MTFVSVVGKPKNHFCLYLDYKNIEYSYDITQKIQ